VTGEKGSAGSGVASQLPGAPREVPGFGQAESLFAPRHRNQMQCRPSGQSPQTTAAVRLPGRAVQLPPGSFFSSWRDGPNSGRLKERKRRRGEYRPGLKSCGRGYWSPPAPSVGAWLR